jgi:Short C-terminal domain/Phospholipase_D-nuclease N-terminal
MANHTVILADSGYPLLNAFWTMLLLFLWILWFFLLFRIFADIFRSHDLSGWGKAAWSVFIVILPFLGVFVYVIARGSHMHERDLAQAKAADDAFRAYAKQTLATPASSAEELTKLAALHDKGVLSDAEFAAQKAKILA